MRSGHDAQASFKRHKGQEADENAHAKEKVSIGLHENKTHALACFFAEEDFREEMEDGIAEEAADGESDHERERRGVDVGWAEGEEEVGRAGDVKCG